MLIKNCIQTHAGLSPTAIIKLVQQMQKRAEIIVHNRTLLASKLVKQQAIATAASKRKSQKKKRI
jgi:hypothetical protein